MLVEGFNMKKAIVVLFVSGILLCFQMGYGLEESKIEGRHRIISEEQIEKKENLKNLLLAKAAKAQEQGDALKENLKEAQKFWLIADAYREKAKLIDNIKYEMISEEEKTPSWERQVDEIDNEIDKKKNQRNLFLAKAARAQDQGDRLQFNRDNLGEARRFWQVADSYKEKAKLLELEIDLLERKRVQILKENNIFDH